VATDTQKSFAACNIEADAISAALSSGFIRMYDGVKPVNGDTAVGAQTKLAEGRFGVTAFPPASAGELSGSVLLVGLTGGDATWFRALRSDGTTVIFDGTVGLSDCNINLETVTIVLNAQVDVSELKYSVPRVGS
jgi:hypothetical protein